mmetsp:Transcript_14136/g.34268  ORF Transcript_14136/g.34268 Transcript_14136/m.34268 type:complete len:512 (+) Transcript_14136:43-1578(+)
MLRLFLFFHVLSSLLNLSLGATTVVEWSLPDDLQPYEQISVFAGDSIRFEYPGDSINVLRTAGSCDSTDSELIGAVGAGSATYTFSEDQIDTVVTFATDYWNYCSFGMIINVLVLAPPPSEVPSDMPSLVPSAAAVPEEPAPAVPTVAPTQAGRADDPGLIDTISVGDETAIDWSLPEDLQPYEQISIYAGDTLRFDYPGTTINVLRNPSGTCDATGSELIGAAGGGSATYTFDDSQIDTVVTFATDYWNYCSFGMLINVLVLQPPPSSAPSLSPSAASSEAPTLFPTLSPTEPVPTNPPTSVANLVVEEAVLDWSLPDDLQPYDQISVYARGTIRFEYPGTNINVLRYPSGTCDSTGSELVGAAGQGNVTYTFTEDQIDTVITFATDYWNYCGFGMIIGVFVLEPPPSAAPSEAPSGIPTLAPVVSTEVPSIAPTPTSPIEQPTIAPVPTDAPFADPSETDEPTIAKKTRPPTSATTQPAGDTGTATSAATSLFKQTLCVILASVLALVI